MAELNRRLEALAELAEATAGRVPPELTERARGLVQRAGERLAHGTQTVVALAGATGSGKSSLFNALAGQELAQPGVRRPMTSETLAVSFSPTNTHLLDWLGITRRAEAQPLHRGMDQMVLLDLPDFDSTQRSHHAEVDRLAPVVDQFCWVTDPQKYADAAMHQRYLRPLATHADVMTVVLNQADRLSEADLRACLDDLRRHLADDGLSGVPVMATSARTGYGVEELRQHLSRIAERKSAGVARLNADVDQLSAEFALALGEARTGKPSKETITQLNRALEQAAGVPVVVDAVHGSMIHRGGMATGWPFTSWLRRLRPDPLKRLRIGGRRKGEITQGGEERSSLPSRGPVAEAQVRTGLRTLANQVSDGMPPRWQQAVHDAVETNHATLADSLDRAIVSAPLGTDRSPVWWHILRGLQWLLIAAVVVGLGWLGTNLIFSYFMLPPLPSAPIEFPNGLRLPLPTLLVIGGLLSGVVLSAVSRFFVGLGARQASRRAASVLRKQVAAVAEREVLQPVQTELDRYTHARDLLRRL